MGLSTSHYFPTGIYGEESELNRCRLYLSVEAHLPFSTHSDNVFIMEYSTHSSTAHSCKDSIRFGSNSSRYTLRKKL